jgi:hypothetical protein
MQMTAFPQVLTVSATKQRISITSKSSRRAVTPTCIRCTAGIVLLLPAIVLSCLTFFEGMAREWGREGILILRARYLPQWIRIGRNNLPSAGVRLQPVKRSDDGLMGTEPFCQAKVLSQRISSKRAIPVYRWTDAAAGHSGQHHGSRL